MASLARFEKYEGLGNDFVVIDAGSEGELSEERARALCDRRRGVGADGVLLLLPPRVAEATARMRVVNADGSIAEMCGNGLRCAALHLARARGVSHGDLAIETDAGVRACAIDRSGDAAVVVCDMGMIRVQDDVVVDLGAERVALTRADAGNPHAVALRAFTPGDLAQLGPQLAAAPVFFARGGVNIELAQRVAGVLDVVVGERGAGATLACGTGACAAVAVARAKGVVSGEGSVRVRLPGGELEVGLDPRTGRTTLRGPARHVFSGDLPGEAT